ncbi:hypothetical protein F5884DRAFT_56628 [Xylogone sp. PMI_703]|nr:hypothetical protein F5884DRAFT_56628 [Xylogone sp. PMI_703]
MKTASFSTLVALLLAAPSLIAAVPPFDPAGAKNVGNGNGGQFIGGQCLSDADCGSGCCANPTGICSGPGAQFQNGKTGCGFGGSGTPSVAASPAAADATTAAAAVSAAIPTDNANGGPPFDPAGVKNVGNGVGAQFIGGQCLSGADCASGCCAGPSGICSGPGAQTQAGKTGCGFVSPALGGTTGNAAAVAAPPAAADTTAAPAPAPASASSTPSNGGPAFDPAGDKNVGNGQGKQFIGGQCLNTADCASGCCAGPSGICSGPGAQFQNGKTGCGFQSKRRLVRF